jgi:hypothetical protein
LIFLTPWNKIGFELSLKYADKLDYVSPCWYSLQTDSKGQPVFENIHNYNAKFASAIRRANPSIKLVPRVYVEGSQSAFFQSIGSNKGSFKKAVSLIAQIIEDHSLDGIVWDTPFNFFEKSRSPLNVLIVEFLTAVRKELPGKILLFNMGSPIDHMASLDLNSYRKLPI